MKDYESELPFHDFPNAFRPAFERRAPPSGDDVGRELVLEP